MNWIKSHKLIIGILGALGIGGSIAIGAITNPEPPFVPQAIDWVRPTSDAEWAEDVKQEQLNYRFDFQLEEMRANLAEKIVKHKDDLDRLIECPDCFKYPLQKEGLKTPEINQRYDEQVAQARGEYERVGRSLERIENEQRLRTEGKVERTQDIIKIHPSTDREREELKKLR